MRNYDFAFLIYALRKKRFQLKEKKDALLSKQRITPECEKRIREMTEEISEIEQHLKSVFN